jgi:hypothetical protein
MSSVSRRAEINIRPTVLNRSGALSAGRSDRQVVINYPVISAVVSDRNDLQAQLIAYSRSHADLVRLIRDIGTSVNDLLIATSALTSWRSVAVDGLPLNTAIPSEFHQYRQGIRADQLPDAIQESAKAILDSLHAIHQSLTSASLAHVEIENPVNVEGVPMPDYPSDEGRQIAERLIAGEFN